MRDRQDRFWKSHYDDLATAAKPWLDYSNDRVQAQTFALALEAAGPIQDRCCLDFGCGFGLLSMALEALGAAAVCGVDQSAVIINRNRQRNTSIEWILGQALDIPREVSYDLVFAIEVLHYLPFQKTLGELWDHVAPGGRLVAVVPNRDCPLVQRPTERYEGHYWPPTGEEISTSALGLPELAYWGIRGLRFAADQSIVPYDVTKWTNTPPLTGVPNRFIFVAGKHSSG